MSHFTTMLRSGAIADEETFRVVLTAAAREGEVSTVKSVLRKVWNIDVDAIMAGKDENDILPREMPKASPLHPTSKLLFTVAHAFGINNDVPAALRLVDFIARHYDITIPLEVWSQLFEWTFVLALNRPGSKSHSGGFNVNALPRSSVLRLWETMTNSPYFIQPTMGMYNHLVKNLMLQGSTPELAARMEEGRIIYRQSYERSKELLYELKSELALRDSVRGTALEAEVTSHSRSLEHMRADFEQADLIRRRNRFWLRRWLRLLLASVRQWVYNDPSPAWSLEHIPRMLWEWRDYAPRHVRYETAGGIVEFTIKTDEEILAQQRRNLEFHQGEQEILDRVPRYVGGSWLREYHMPKRLAEALMAESTQRADYRVVGDAGDQESASDRLQEA